MAQDTANVQRASWENIVNIETLARRTAASMVGHVWPRLCWGKPHADVPWASQARTASTQPLTPALCLTPARMEAPAMCLAGMPTSAPAKLVLQVNCVNGLMPACLIPVQMEVPVPQWPTSSPALASQASQGRSVRLTSMNVTFQDSARMGAPASTFQVPISANVPRALQASTVTAPMCPVHPPPVSMEAPAGRLETSPLSATAFQVSKASPVRGILMTALTTSVRMEGFVWMGSTLTTAAAPLSGQDSSAQRM